MAKSVVALMDSIDEVRILIDDLITQGIDRGAISIVASESEGASLTAEGRNQLNDEQIAGVTWGFGAGAGIGGAIGLVAGLSAFAVPGGALIAGPLMATLAGAGIGAYTGGVIGAIRNLGMTEEESAFYAEGVQRGGICVGVEVGEADAGRVESIMRDHGAVDIVQRVEEWRRAGWEGPEGCGSKGAGDRERPHH